MERVPRPDKAYGARKPAPRRLRSENERGTAGEVGWKRAAIPRCATAEGTVAPVGMTRARDCPQNDEECKVQRAALPSQLGASGMMELRLG